MNKIIEQVLEFLECDTPKIAIKEFLEDELKAIEKDKSFIGLTDTSNKKIYADSSIFEFGYSVGEAVHIGYFYYDKDDLAYKIKILSSILKNRKSNKFKGQSFLFDRGMINFKIIDTIQENKLGLIK